MSARQQNIPVFAQFISKLQKFRLTSLLAGAMKIATEELSIRLRRPFK